MEMESHHIGFEFEYRALQGGTQEWHLSGATTQRRVSSQCCAQAFLSAYQMYD